MVLLLACIHLHLRHPQLFMQLFSPPLGVYKISCKISPIAAPPSRHHILTKPGLPVFAKSHSLVSAKLVKTQFSTMEKAGIICPSTSPLASPLHMIKKKDCRLKTATVPDRYPLLNITDLTSCVSGSTIFPSWIYRRNIIRLQLRRRTFKRLPSSPPVGCSSS